MKIVKSKDPTKGTRRFELFPVGPTGPNAEGVVGIKPPELEFELPKK